MLKFDDQFPIHRKVSRLSDAAFRLHVEAIFWCARNLTDGFIGQGDLVSVSRYRRPQGYVAELVNGGLWDVVDDGWQIHDYLDWQDSRDKVLRIREARRAAGRAGGIRSAQSRSKPKAKLKQVASDSVEPRAPRPPTGGSGGAHEGAAPSCRGFVPDSDPKWCKQCGLPRVNRVHSLSPKQVASQLLDVDDPRSRTA